MPMYMQYNPCKTFRKNTLLQHIQLENSHIVQQQTRSVAFIRKAQTTLFLICRVYQMVKKAFLHELKKPCITTGVLRPMHNKDKMHKKYINVNAKIPNF